MLYFASHASPTLRVLYQIIAKNLELQNEGFVKNRKNA